jgi:hypothetical protein
LLACRVREHVVSDRQRRQRVGLVLPGHASIVTTERYTAVDDDEIRAAMMAAMTE